MTPKCSPGAFAMIRESKCYFFFFCGAIISVLNLDERNTLSGGANKDLFLNNTLAIFGSNAI